MAARGRLGIELRNYRRRRAALRHERAPDCAASDESRTQLKTAQIDVAEGEADRRRSDELRQIEAALQRMADGRYGYCLTCGESIAPDRLEGDPTAALCNDCARLAGTPAPAGR